MATSDQEVEEVFNLARQIQAKADSTLITISALDHLNAQEIKSTIDTILLNEFKHLEAEVMTDLADINRACDYKLCIVDAPKKTENLLQF